MRTYSQKARRPWWPIGLHSRRYSKRMNPRPYGSLASGETVEAHTLKNSSGASAEVLSYGGIVTSLRMPDRQGRLADVVLGFNDLGSYLSGTAYFGAIIG